MNVSDKARDLCQPDLDLKHKHGDVPAITTSDSVTTLSETEPI